MNTRSTERYPGFGCRRVCNMRSNCLSRFSRRRQKRLRARTMNLFLLPKPKRGLAARAQRIREISLQLYTEAAAYAQTRGILIADTKFEFGLDENGTLVWMDEAF